MPIEQQMLFDWGEQERDAQAQRSGTFVDNMKLPVHRWFRYSAGFSAQWVAQLLSGKGK